MWCFRESDVNQLRSEVHEVLGNRNMTDEKFQAVVLDEIAGLKVRPRHFLFSSRRGSLGHLYCGAGTNGCQSCLRVQAPCPGWHVYS